MLRLDRIEILLDSIILIFLALSLLLCIVLLITIFASNVPILLTFNTYLTLFLTLMLIIYVYNLYGDLYPLMSITSLFCECLFLYFILFMCFKIYLSIILNSFFSIEIFTITCCFYECNSFNSFKFF
jgi:hypothetical protein